MVAVRIKILLFFITFGCLNAAPFEFRHLTILDGLSSSKVTCIIQDQQGYMWFGTYDGLNRFDGSEFIVYRHEKDDPFSLSDNIIKYFFQDSADRLWVSTSVGLNLYDPARDHFILFPDENNLPVGELKLVETNDQQLIAINRTDIYEIDLADSVCVRKTSPALKAILQDNLGTTDMFVEPSGMLWISSNKKGLSLISREYDPIHSFNVENSADMGLHTSAIRQIVADSSGNFWMASHQGLYYFDRQANRFHLYQHDPNDPSSLSTSSCFSVYMDPDENLWIIMTNGGVNLKRKNSHTFEHIRHDPKNIKSLNSDAVQCIYVDHQKNVWIGTINGLSVAFHQRSAVQSYRHDPEQPSTLSNNNVTSFAEDRKGNLWLTTDGGGLNYFNRTTEKFQRFTAEIPGGNNPLSDALLCCLYDSTDKLWIGGYMSGLSLLDIHRGEYKHILHSRYGISPFGGDDVRAILRDHTGDIWIATPWEGVVRFIQGDPYQAKYFKNNSDDPTALPGNHCLSLFEDSRGIIWIGSYGGLSRFNRQTGDYYTYQEDAREPGHLSHNWINVIYEDTRQRLWIGTAEGLNLLDRQTDTFTIYNTKDGLPGNLIAGILEDDHGRLWVSTNNGIARFHPDSDDFLIFTQTDGLQSNEFSQGAALKLSTGEMAFGGTFGFSIFYPDSLSESRLFPKVQLQKLEFLNQPTDPLKSHPKEQVVSQSSEIVLERNQSRTFRLHYSAIEFKTPDKIRYYYRLDGYDSQWVYNGTNRTITFMNLSPGRYNLNVAATSVQHEPAKNYTTLKLIILPGWWETPLAYIGYMIFIIGLFLIYHFNSNRFMRLRIALEKQMVEKEKAQELQNLKSRFFTNISHEFRTPLTLILVPLRELMKAAEKENNIKQFRLMKRSAERLLRLVNQVIDLNKIESGRLELFKKEIDLVDFIQKIIATFTPLTKDKNITIVFETSAPYLYALLDPDKMDIIIFNLLSNALKFSPEHTQIFIRLYVKGDHIVIQVQDKGPGVPEEVMQYLFDRFYQVRKHAQQNPQGAGIGLALSKELINLHDGDITVENCRPGTLFTITLPIIAPIHPVSRTVPQAEEYSPPLPLPEKEKNKTETVLIVEDDADLRFYLKEKLQKEYQVLTAVHGAQGVQVALKSMPDLILSDVMMAEMDGMQLCRKVKSDQLTSHIPVILLTARSSEEHHLQGLETGADDYITKPFNLDILRARIQNLLNNRRKLREQFSEHIQLSSLDDAFSSTDKAFIEKGIKVVESNMQDFDFSVEMMGKELGLSRSQLFRKLKALTNETPMEFIQHVRLRRAVQLLVNTSLTVTEIAYNVGFNYPNNFAKIFQKHFGVSPSDYRKKQKS